MCKTFDKPNSGASDRENEMCLLAVAFTPIRHLESKLLHPFCPLAWLASPLLFFTGIAAMLSPEFVLASLPFSLEALDNVNRSTAVKFHG